MMPFPEESAPTFVCDARDLSIHDEVSRPRRAGIGHGGSTLEAFGTPSSAGLTTLALTMRILVFLPASNRRPM